MREDNFKSNVVVEYENELYLTVHDFGLFGECSIKRIEQHELQELKNVYLEKVTYVSTYKEWLVKELDIRGYVALDSETTRGIKNKNNDIRILRNKQTGEINFCGTLSICAYDYWLIHQYLTSSYAGEHNDMS